MRLIDADAYSAEMKDRQEAAWKWRNEAIAEEDEVKLARAEGAYTAFTEAKLTMDKHIISPWHRVEDWLPKKGTYLVAVRWAKDNHFSYEIAHFTDKLEDVFPFEYEAVSGPGWYIWSDYNDDNAQISPEYWMPIEPPKEEEHGN